MAAYPLLLLLLSSLLQALPKLVEVEKAPSMQGARLDRFAESSKARYYLHSREDMGAGQYASAHTITERAAYNTSLLSL